MVRKALGISCQYLFLSIFSLHPKPSAHGWGVFTAGEATVLDRDGVQLVEEETVRAEDGPYSIQIR